MRGPLNCPLQDYSKCATTTQLHLSGPTVQTCHPTVLPFKLFYAWPWLCSVFSDPLALGVVLCHGRSNVSIIKNPFGNAAVVEWNYIYITGWTTEKTGV